MASNENLKSVHYLSAKLSVNFQLPEGNTHSRTTTRQPIRRRKISMTTLIIVALALALLLAAVLVIGITRKQASHNDAPSENTNKTGAGSTPSPPPSEPPGGDQGLSWCQNRDEGICTLGVYQNLDTGQIRAQVFDHICRSLGSSDRIKLESASAINSTLPEAVVLLVHGITGTGDEFWYNGTHYSDGWVWQNPSPVWYETQSFPCL
ncbi:hypothetical protein KVR01_010203 [Diaporthe batatas]|uniref:uncharacterized protein n=1 Tax=Diaporthe batatas TaxID=748121 RepID=UPI001D04A481|nr:uncharacterized protein KVR01_010203 [Diaporthe batatas]KAG8159566.1 hypothetical protein KVR01_010203 [Diaporthe batatas]